MNIVLLNDDFPPAGNSSVSSVVAQLQKGMQARGHTVHIITTHREEYSKEIIRNNYVSSFPVSYRPSLRFYKSILNRKLGPLLHSELVALKPDVVHAHNIHMYLSYGVLNTARKCTDRIFLTAHDVMSFSCARLATERYLNSQGTDARVTMLDQMHQVGLQWNPLYMPVIQSTIGSKVDKLVAVSHALERALHANGLHNTEVIHHGIDVDEWSASKESIIDMKKRYRLDGKKIILFGGRLSLDKGAHELLRAFEQIVLQLPEAHLLIIGEEKRWKPIIDSFNTHTDLDPHCTCTGWVSREEMRILMHCADVVTTPSLCLDTFNLINLEAMAAARPVVGTIFGGTPEVVQHEETGFICDPRKTQVYTSYLRKLLTDEQCAKKMGSAGYKRAQTTFNESLFIERHVSLYNAG